MGLSVKYAIKLLRSRTGSVPYSRTRHKSTLSSPVPTSKIISLKSLSILVFLIPNKIIAKIPKNISIRRQCELNPSASGCYVFVTPDLNTWFSLTLLRQILRKVLINSSNFLLFQNIYVLFWKFDQTSNKWMIFAARFESASF